MTSAARESRIVTCGEDTLNECSAVQHVERAAGPNSQLETDYMRGD